MMELPNINLKIPIKAEEILKRHEKILKDLEKHCVRLCKFKDIYPGGFFIIIENCLDLHMNPDDVNDYFVKPYPVNKLYNLSRIAIKDMLYKKINRTEAIHMGYVDEIRIIHKDRIIAPVKIRNIDLEIDITDPLDSIKGVIPSKVDKRGNEK